MTFKTSTEPFGDQSGFGLNGTAGSALPNTYPNMQKEFEQWTLGNGRSYLEYNSFSGVDIKAAVWIPPSPSNPTGSYRVWSELQTVTISSERPAGPVRSLGVASVRDYVRGVRTIAGSMIFTLLDKDVFVDLYQENTKESPSFDPVFVDVIPSFHIILNGVNEMGLAAGLVIAECTITNMGQTFSVDDLLLEATYTYVAKYVSPFTSPWGWRDCLAGVLAGMKNKGIMMASTMARPNGYPKRESPWDFSSGRIK